MILPCVWDECYGSGIHRILDDCREAALPEPLFENFSGGFRIKFLQAEGSSEDDGALNVLSNGALSGALSGALTQQILQLLSQTPGIRRKSIADALAVPERTLDRHLARLLADGIIERRGSKKTGGYWVGKSD